MPYLRNADHSSAALDPSAASHPQLGSYGAAHVKQISERGNSNEYVLKTAATPSYSTYPQIIDSLSAKLVTIDVLESFVAGSAFFIGWSLNASDAAAIGAILDSYYSELASPGSIYPPAFSNARLITPNKDLKAFSLEWDGINPIKTIAVRGFGASGAASIWTIPVSAIET